MLLVVKRADLASSRYLQSVTYKMVRSNIETYLEMNIDIYKVGQSTQAADQAWKLIYR